VVPLTTGFRVPASVLVLANSLLPALAVDVPAAVSLRSDGELRTQLVSDVDGVAGAVVAAVRRALRTEGSIGVIAPDTAVAGLRTALGRAGIETATADEVETEIRVTLLPATVAKGLEYDHVVVVEPADIVAAEARGLNRLYVVLTRAVSRLDIVHAKPLPAALSGLPAGAAERSPRSSSPDQPAPSGLPAGAAERSPRSSSPDQPAPPGLPAGSAKMPG
jgi:DNA helicase IV